MEAAEKIQVRADVAQKRQERLDSVELIWSSVEMKRAFAELSSSSKQRKFVTDQMQKLKTQDGIDRTRLKQVSKDPAGGKKGVPMTEEELRDQLAEYLDELEEIRRKSKKRGKSTTSSGKRGKKK